jgi:hypothetical protein
MKNITRWNRQCIQRPDRIADLSSHNPEAGVGFIKALLRVFAYIFGGLLALFVTVISLVAFTSHSPLNLTFLPWTGDVLTYWLLGLGLFGLFTLLLAMSGKARVLFFLWWLALFVLLLRGLFLSSYSFSGPLNFKAAAYLTVGSLAAALGAFPWAQKPGPIRKPQKW